MGLLSNPQTRSQISDFVGKRANLLSFFMFVGGCIWMVALVHPSYNGGVYFSENALLPGMAKVQFQGKGLESHYEAYQAQIKTLKAKSDVPENWVEDQLIAIGLEVYTQDYKFTYPMNLLNNQTAQGKNVYGILRAPRTPSVESVVMTTPLRPSSSGLTPTDGSVALMLSLAQHMKKSTYWSKDIIFLFSQHEFVGLQAWLDGYLGMTTSKYIEAGSVEGRGGLLQAAINLEFEALRFGGISVLTEGLNGQLPNLDLVNVINKLIRDANIPPAIHGRTDIRTSDMQKMVKHNLITAFTMIAHQATGMASANHGLFLRYRIDAVTLRGEKGSTYRLSEVGKILEGVYRSINNLLEKFHQSFFFYILPCTYRYVSIGVYMPPLALMAAAGLIQALALWGKFCQDVAGRNDNLVANKDTAFTADGRFTEDALRSVRLPDNVLQGIYQLTPLIIGCHLAGFMILKAPDFFGNGEIKQLSAVDAVILGSLACIIACMLLARTVIRKEEFDDLNWHLFKTIALIYHGICMFSLALLNFSLSLVVTTFTVPVYCFIRPRKSKILTILQAAILVIFSPLGIMISTHLLYNLLTGVSTLNRLQFGDLLVKAQDSIIYSLIDHQVFNNYLISVVIMVLYPIWLMFWSLIWMND